MTGSPLTYTVTPFVKNRSGSEFSQTPVGESAADTPVRRGVAGKIALTRFSARAAVAATAVVEGEQLREGAGPAAAEAGAAVKRPPASTATVASTRARDRQRSGLTGSPGRIPGAGNTGVPKSRERPETPRWLNSKTASDRAPRPRTGHRGSVGPAERQVRSPCRRGDRGVRRRETAWTRGEHLTLIERVPTGAPRSLATGCPWSLTPPP